MLFCCSLGLLAPLPLAGADEQPQGFVKITVDIEGEGLERIPIVGPLLKHYVEGKEQPCAEHEQVKLPPPPVCPAQAATVQAVPMLSELPYVGKLFKHIVLAPANEQCETVEADCPATRAPTVQQFRFVGPDGLERIGVDFDCDVTKECAQCQATRCAQANVARPVATCAAPPANCPSVAVYPPPAGSYAVQACETLPAPMAMLQAQSGRDELIEVLMEARIEAAVAQTALKAREESDAKQLELIKELLSSQIENARLTAKLDLAAEKEKMLAELYEARVELTALQVHVARENDVAQRKRQRKDAEARRPVEAVETLR
jgi:hypothetical protein